MIDIKKYNVGTYLVLGLSFLNIIFYFMPFVYGKLVESQLSGYDLLLLMFDPSSATGVGASLFNDPSMAGMQFSPYGYVIAILSFLYLCISFVIIIFCFLDLMGYRANKKMVSYLAYSLVFVLVVTLLLIVVRSEFTSSASRGIGLGYGLIVGLTSSLIMSILRVLKIK